MKNLFSKKITNLIEDTHAYCWVCGGDCFLSCQSCIGGCKGGCQSVAQYTYTCTGKGCWTGCGGCSVGCWGQVYPNI
jgi:hypothetical protein